MNSDMSSRAQSNSAIVTTMQPAMLVGRAVWAVGHVIRSNTVVHNIAADL